MRRGEKVDLLKLQKDAGQIGEEMGGSMSAGDVTDIAYFEERLADDSITFDFARGLLDDLEAAIAEVAALRAQLAERCVVGPDEVVVKREEWAALGQIVTLVNKHINDPCYLRNQLVPIVDKVSALRSGEAGKGVV